MISKLTSVTTLFSFAVALAVLPCGCVTDPGAGLGSNNAAQTDAAATAALQHLYASRPAAKALGRKALDILIFPDVVKAGFMWGGEIGNGVLRQNGRTTGYYNITAASYGLQAACNRSATPSF
jgi:lipid-binding SYLF domain-containing protein